MLPQTREKNAQVSYSGLFWGGIVTLMVAQIAAFWLLCSQQVRKAELRDATAHQERLALAECMGAPKSTVSACVARAAALQGASRNTVLASDDKALAGEAAPPPGMNGPLPVSFMVR